MVQDRILIGIADRDMRDIQRFLPKMELSFRGNRGLNNKNNYLNAFTSLLF